MRITREQLDRAVSALARAMGTTIAESYNDVGAIMVDQAYGGNKLVMIISETGGQSDISRTGYISVRDLYNRIHFAVDILHEIPLIIDLKSKPND